MELSVTALLLLLALTYAITTIALIITGGNPFAITFYAVAAACWSGASYLRLRAQ